MSNNNNTNYTINQPLVVNKSITSNGNLLVNGSVKISGSLSGTPSSNSGVLTSANYTFTDTNTASSGTLSNFYSTYIGAPVLAASNSSVSTTNAYNVYISGAPLVGTNETINNSYALGVVGPSIFYNRITSTVLTGTSPLVVSSSTLVSNLNANYLNGSTFDNPGPIGSSTASSGTFTSLSLSSQLTSTVSTGTPPLIVSSSTNVSNLNASYLSGATFAAPGPIGSTTASSGAFTGLSSSNLIISGSSSGSISILPQSNAGTFNFNLPISAGSSGQILISGGGGSNPMSWLNTTGSGSAVLSNSPTLVTPNIGAASGTSLSVSGQLTSTIATGTAPLIVSSSTVVSNLNASYLSGATFAAPGPIGSSTASTGAFTGLSSSNLTISGSTSGYVLISSTTGTYNFNLPTSAGSSGQVLTSSGGGSNSMFWSSAGTGSVSSVAVAVPDFLSVSGSPITSVGTITLSYSGTAIPVTSGGTGATTSTGTGSVVLSASPTITGTLTTAVINSTTSTTSFTPGNIFTNNGATNTNNLTLLAPNTVGSGSCIQLGTDSSVTQNSGLIVFNSVSSGNNSNSISLLLKGNTNSISIYKQGTTSTSSTTGTVTISGGLGVAGDINISGTKMTVGNGEFTLDGNSGATTTMITIGKNSVKPSVGQSIFNVYNNTTDQTSLFQVNTAGSSSGVNSVAVNTTLNVSGIVTLTNGGSSSVFNVQNSTVSTSITTGCAVFNGGVGISGALYPNKVYLTDVYPASTLVNYRGFQVIWTSPASRVYIEFDSTGGTPIGSISNNTTSTSYNTLSDYRFKYNVKKTSKAFDRLKKIPIVDFNFVGDDPDDIRQGFLAHELQEVVPYAVTGKKDDIGEDGKVRPQFVDYSKLVPLIIRSVQELSKRIEVLEGLLEQATATPPTV